MKIKTSELIGAALDWAVAKADGWSNDGLEDIVNGDKYPEHDFSTSWSQGGPIIDREDISTVREGDAAEWVASLYDYAASDWYLHTHGPTPLIAAMRCYVASKLGDEVEVPEKLL